VDSELSGPDPGRETGLTPARVRGCPASTRDGVANPPTGGSGICSRTGLKLIPYPDAYEVSF
jgi:hypothetical protein